MIQIAYLLYFYDFARTFIILIDVLILVSSDLPNYRNKNWNWNWNWNEIEIEVCRRNFGLESYWFLHGILFVSY